MNGDSIIKAITQQAFSKGRDLATCFTDMLDAFIDFLSYERLQANGCDVTKVMESIKDDDWFEIFLMWLEWVEEKQRCGRTVDAFDFYEGAVKSKGKADMLGQFYTLMALCNCMAEVIDEEPKEGVVTVLDCAVGSGRTLLGHANTFIKHKRPNVAYYQGGDIDTQSVKMCTINLAINGLLGRVLIANGLTLEYYGGYEVNEVKYPFWTQSTSIRKLPKPQGFSKVEDVQRECNAYMQLESERKEKLEALYQCRIGNPQPCISMIPTSVSQVEKAMAEAQIISMSKAMANHFEGTPLKAEVKEEPKQEPQQEEKVEAKEVKPTEAPIENADSKHWVQRSLFD